MEWRNHPQSISLSANTIDVWHLDMNQAQADYVNHYSTLSRDEKKRADRFVFDIHRYRYAACRAVLRRLLSLYRNTASVDFAYNDYGKPNLPGKDIEFNVSHSDDQALLVFSHPESLGVDIELIRADLDLNGMASQIFNANDLNNFCALPDQAKPAAFFRAWTRKEAVIKCLGLGFSYDVKDCEVNFLAEDEDACLVHLTGYESEEYELSSPPVFSEKFEMAIVSHSKHKMCRYFKYGCE